MSVGIDLVVIVCVVVGVALTGSIVAVVLWVLRGSDPDRAVASVFATPATPFTLRFTTSARGVHRLWLRFELEHGGGRYEYGLTAQVEPQVGPAPAWSVEMRVGATAPVLGPNGVWSTSLVRASHYAAVMGRASVRATAEIASLPAAPSDTPVEIAGTVVVAEGSRRRASSSSSCLLESHPR